MSDFKPLDAQRAIRDDAALNVSGKALLWSAVLRTDNATRKVRASLTMLAKDAGVHRNTATATFAETNTPVVRYFEKIERRTRRIDLWFHPSDGLAAGPSHSTCASGANEVTDDMPTKCAREAAEVTDGDEPTKGDAQLGRPSARQVCKDMHSTCAPSALSAFSSAGQLVKPSTLQDDDHTGQDESTGEPITDVWKTLAEEIAQHLPCGCFPGSSCPECRGDKPATSKHSPEKLKQFHDGRMERDENLGLDGTPKDMATASSGYRSRGRS